MARMFPAARRSALSARSAVGVARGRFRRHRCLLAAFRLARRRRASRRARSRRSVYDLDYLRARIASRRGFRLVLRQTRPRATRRQRTPITDGLGKPWMFRQKDLRLLVVAAALRAGRRRRALAPTAWVAAIEADLDRRDRLSGGRPAAPTRPMFFPIRTPAKAACRYFSRGGRDDLMQARFLEAMLTHFDPAAPAARPRNPTSSVYGGPMVDPARIHVWCWDARPFPAFPTQSATGRRRQLGDRPLAERAARGRAARPPGRGRSRARFRRRVSSPRRPDIQGFLDGYVLERAMSPREAIDPLAALFGFDAVVLRRCIRFVSRRGKPARTNRRRRSRRRRRTRRSSR